MTKNGQPFYWCLLHNMCFQMIKNICCTTPVLRPIDSSQPDPIWVICDALVFGVGAMYRQGPNWRTCQPAGFLSKKFTDAQGHYHIYEQETIVILEALLKWEDKLVRYCIHVVTDHKALEFFNMQSKFTVCQVRWTDYLSWFDLDIHYIKRKLNKIVDALSHYSIMTSDRPYPWTPLQQTTWQLQTPLIGKSTPMASYSLTNTFMSQTWITSASRYSETNTTMFYQDIWAKTRP